MKRKRRNGKLSIKSTKLISTWNQLTEALKLREEKQSWDIHILLQTCQRLLIKVWTSLRIWDSKKLSGMGTRRLRLHLLTVNIAGQVKSMKQTQATFLTKGKSQRSKQASTRTNNISARSSSSQKQTYLLQWDQEMIMSRRKKAEFKHFWSLMTSSWSAQKFPLVMDQKAKTPSSVWSGLNGRPVNENENKRQDCLNH